MTIVARGRSWQAAVHWKGRRARRSFDNKRDAVEWEEEALKAMKAGRPIPEPGQYGEMTMKELLRLTADRYWKGAKSEHSLIQKAELVLEVLGEDTPVRGVTTAEIDRMVGQFRRLGNSPATINRKLAALSRMMVYAERLDVIRKRPHIEKLKEDERRLLWWSVDLEKRVLAWLHDRRLSSMADYVQISVDTGLRQGEVFRISKGDVEDVGGHHGSLRVHVAKGRRGRSVPLTGRARAILDRRLDHREVCSSGLAFPWKEHSVRSVWLRMSDDINDLMLGTPHTMRHTFCSRLAQAGVDLNTIRELAGHSTLAMTLRYAHLAPGNMQKAIEALECNMENV